MSGARPEAGHKRGRRHYCNFSSKLRTTFATNSKHNVYLNALGSAGKETKSFCYAYGNKHCVIHNKTRLINFWKFISIKIQKFLAYRFPIMLLLLGR